MLMQRDLPAWGLTAKPQLTERLLRMLAASHGQTWNASQIGQSLGLSYHTVNGYLDYLDGAFLIRRLAPYHANIGKRLVKSPKVFWRDSGLLHAVLNVPDTKELLHQPWVGASWEGFVIEQVLGVLKQCDCAFEPYFLRTSDQHEIDLLLDFGRDLWAVEVKLTANPSLQDMERLNRTADMVGANRRFLVAQVRTSVEGKSQASCNLPWLLERLEEQFAQRRGKGTGPCFRPTVYSPNTSVAEKWTSPRPRRERFPLPSAPKASPRGCRMKNAPATDVQFLADLTRATIESARVYPEQETVGEHEGKVRSRTCWALRPFARRD